MNFLSSRVNFIRTAREIDPHFHVTKKPAIGEWTSYPPESNLIEQPEK